MNKRLLKVLQFLILLIIGLYLIKASLAQVSFDALGETLKQGDYRIALPVLAVSLMGYYFRTMRLKLMLNGIGTDCRKRSLYAALCMGYLVSFVVPRLGELSRALIIKKTDGVRIDFTLLAIVAERIIDTLTLMLLFACTYYFFPKSAFSGIDFFNSLNSMPAWFWVLVTAIVGALIVLTLVLSQTVRLKLLQYKPALFGMKTIFKQIPFWLLTIGIWACYYLMTWLWFWLFPETRILTPLDALIVMIAGSFGRSIPVQGGAMGVYHFVVSRILLLLGINLVTGNALALVIHGAQAMITLTTGVLSYLWMLYELSKNQVAEPSKDLNTLKN